MIVSLSRDLQDSVRRRVESGQFPSEEAVVEEALRAFLVDDPAAPGPRRTATASRSDTRAPGPFIAEEPGLNPGDIPRSGDVIGCSRPSDETRRPDLFPAE